MYFTLSVGCNKHFCFKHFAHRSVKLTCSRRSLIVIAYFLLKYDKKTIIVLIKNHSKKYYHFFNLSSVELCWHTLCHDRVSIWWSLDAKTLDFKLQLQTCEIDLFTYPTLTKRPAEIALLGCEWQQVKMLYWNGQLGWTPVAGIMSTR